MNDLNSVLLEGNLTRDPEMKYTQSGSAICTFSIAVNRSYKKGDEWEKEVSFIDVTVWGKPAENCSQYLKKGRGVRVVGRLKQDRWEKDGKTNSKLGVIADHVEFKSEGKRQGAEDVPF